MSERPTPETDAFSNRSFEHRSDELEKLYDHAKDLERERDEWYYKAHANAAFTLEARAERDEARRERDEALAAIVGWENKWKCAVEMAAQAEVERDEAREALEYIAHAGLSARHIEDYAKDFLRREEAAK